MEREEYLLRLRQRTSCDAAGAALAATALLTIPLPRCFAANGKEHVVNRIVADRASGYRAAVRIVDQGLARANHRRSASVSSRFVEGLDLGPLQSHHVEGDSFDTGDEARMRSQP